MADKKFLTAKELRAGRYIVLVLNQQGAQHFKRDQWGQREVYYVNENHRGCIHSIFIFPPSVEGKFIFEMEAGGAFAHSETFLKGIVSRSYIRGVCFYDGEVCDPNIISCDRLTVEEIDKTEKRLNNLKEKYLACVDVIKKLLDDLQKQREDVFKANVAVG